MGSRSLALVLLCLFLPAAWPQSEGEERGGLRRDRLPTVYLETTAGHDVSGKLLALSEREVVILAGSDERRFELANLKRVQRKGDSVKNGAIVGALIGVAMGILSGGLADCVDSNGNVGGCGVGSRLGFVALSSGIYAGAGAGIDALIPGRTTLYEAPRATIAHQDPGLRVRFSFTW